MDETDISEIEPIQEGHGLEDIECPHGSRWIWWDENRRARYINRWVQVIIAPNCDCEEPPKPYHSSASKVNEK